VLKAPGVYSALAGGRRSAKTPASDFVTWRDVFSRQGAKRAPQSSGLRRRTDSGMGENVVMKE
jgi:hypothetical protein